MISARRILTIVGTLFTALAAGFMMQYIMESPDERAARGVQVASIAQVANQPVSDAPAEDLNLALTPTLDDAEPAGLPKKSAGFEGAITETASDTKSAPTTGDLQTVGLTDAQDVAPADVLTPPSFAPQPDALPSEPLTLASLDDGIVDTELPREEPVPSFGCETQVAALTSAGAMVDLIIDATCQADAAFTVHHNGMMVSGITDETGLASMMLPALSETAVYIVTFASGETVVAQTDVTSVQDYDRAVVQWSLYDGLQVHALEYGAAYDEEGHIWSGAMGDMTRAARGEGGFMTRAGETTPLSTHKIEVYTFPTGTALQEGSIELSLEATVTEANCGRDLEAQVLQKSGTAAMQVRDLVLAMPECDAVGDFIVLKNMFDDLNIARN